MRYTASQKFLIESDDALRRFERHWLESSDIEDLVPYLTSMVRSGQEPDPSLVRMLDTQQAVELVRLGSLHGVLIHGLTSDQFRSVIGVGPNDLYSPNAVATSFVNLLEDEQLRITWGALGTLYAYLTNREMNMHPAQYGIFAMRQLERSPAPSPGIPPWMVCRRNGRYTRRQQEMFGFDGSDYENRIPVDQNNVMEAFEHAIPYLIRYLGR